jgi:hypothetical protein
MGIFPKLTKKKGSELTKIEETWTKKEVTWTKRKEVT